MREVQLNDCSITYELLLLVSQKFEKNEEHYKEDDHKNNEINEILLLTLFVFVCFYCRTF